MEEGYTYGGAEKLRQTTCGQDNVRCPRRMHTETMVKSTNKVFKSKLLNGLVEDFAKPPMIH